MPRKTAFATFLRHFTKGLIEYGNRAALRDHPPPRKRKKTLPILDDRVFSSLRVRHGGFASACGIRSFGRDAPSHARWETLTRFLSLATPMGSTPPATACKTPEPQWDPGVAFTGAPWGIRTLDHRIRSPVLYPAELMARMCVPNDTARLIIDESAVDVAMLVVATCG